MKTASEILAKYEDQNEHHFMKPDREFIIQAMEEYSNQNCDIIMELDKLKNLYRKENPRPDKRFFLPDRKTFYKWICKKILGE